MKQKSKRYQKINEEVKEMSFENPYLQGLMERVIRRNPAEPEFHQAVKEVLTSLDPVMTVHPEYIKEGVMLRNDAGMPRSDITIVV